jgi:Zn-dependent protease
LRENLPTAREDARVGLAGPIWGLGAAVVAWLLGVGFQLPLAFAVAKVGAWINLFNLTPVWQLDGSRGFHALARMQRWLMAAVIAVAWALTREGLLVLLALAAGWRAFEKQPDRPRDWRVFAEYCALLAIASALVGQR